MGERRTAGIDMVSGGLGCQCQMSTNVSGLSLGLSFRTAFVPALVSI